MKSKTTKAASKASLDPLVGKVHPAKAMFLRNYVGLAENGKLKYEMAYLMNGQPIIQSKQTGQWFTLEWPDILDLAVKAGVDIANKVI